MGGEGGDGDWLWAISVRVRREGVMRQNSSIPAAPPDTPGYSWSGLELGLGQISDTSGSNNM